MHACIQTSRTKVIQETRHILAFGQRVPGLTILLEYWCDHGHIDHTGSTGLGYDVRKVESLVMT